MKSARDALEPIYSKDYYRMEKLAKNERFQERVRWLHTEYAKHGCPIPERGFNTYQEYMDWLNQYWNVHSDVRYRGAFAQEQKHIVESSEIPEAEKAWRVREAEDRLLPPVPGQFQEDLLAEFGLNSKEEKYDNFLESYIFLGKEHLSEPYFSIVWKRDRDSGRMELFLQVFAHTKQEHIDAFWSEVALEQKRLPGYRGKNKPWETFERDLEIFNMYQIVKRDAPKRSSMRNRKAAIPLDYEAWMRLRAEYPARYSSLTITQVRKSVARIAVLDRVELVKAGT